MKGIAGILDFTAVKCLHCHYAHFLARPAHSNIIGQWVQEQLLALGSAEVTAQESLELLSDGTQFRDLDKATEALSL